MRGDGKGKAQPRQGRTKAGAGGSLCCGATEGEKPGPGRENKSESRRQPLLRGGGKRRLPRRIKQPKCISGDQN